MDNKQLGIIGAIIIIIVIIICAFAFLGGNHNTPANTVNNASNDSVTTNVNSTASAGNYQLQINTTGKWRLDLTVDGKYSSNEGQGSKTIDLGTTLGYASVTVNDTDPCPDRICRSRHAGRGAGTEGGDVFQTAGSAGTAVRYSFEAGGSAEFDRRAGKQKEGNCWRD